MNQHPVATRSPIFRTQTIELVEEGMPVVDAAGEKLGKVVYIHMGDPDAESADSNLVDVSGYLPGRSLFAAVEPHLPEPLFRRLMRVGFIKVEGAGLLRCERHYVAADQIAAVEGGTVRLAVRKDQLIEEP